MSALSVTWMREGRSTVTHGFLEIDLSFGFEQVEPIAPCGPFTIAQLQEDEAAARCAACLRALLQMSR